MSGSKRFDEKLSGGGSLGVAEVLVEISVPSLLIY